MLETAKKIVLQAQSQPRRESEEMKSERRWGATHGGPESHFKDFGFNSERSGKTLGVGQEWNRKVT